MLVNKNNNDEIINQVDKVIRYASGYYIDDESQGVKQLVMNCLTHKYDLYKYFGNGLIYTFPEKMTFKLSQSSKKQKIESFKETIYNNTPNYCYNIPESFFPFIDVQANGFFSNEIIAPFEYEDKKIPIGMHLSKAFKFFIKDEEILRKIQDLYSSYIQEAQITGHLCISAHPLDFLSSSENNHNWRSCHALDGDFQAGNLSYMNDYSTLVCYLRSDEDTILPHFPSDVPWNNKKWRMLIHVSKERNMIFYSRQYPFFIEGAIETIQDFLTPLLDKFDGWDLDKDIFHWETTNKGYVTSVTANDKVYKMPNNDLILIDDERLLHKEVIMKEPKTALHFNDILYSSTYQKPYYSIRKSNYDNTAIGSINFNVGATVYCPICGEHKLECSESLICWECHEKINNYDEEEE